ncbi:uncharacterized protein LOC142537707 [Primulina tabacum]|uniref:uncharacterized protein LOC142537707 n=1 Tax=Primulina tabacum TaxID=48773 RepID=UPI003F59BFA7
MPPIRAPSADRQDDIPGGGRGPPPPPPPPLDASTHEFGGTTDPFVAEGWILSLDLHFQYLGMRDGDRVRCAAYMLRDDASLWWEGAAHRLNLAILTWDQFKEAFYGKYFPDDVRGRLKRKFMSLRQRNSTVEEFISKFDRGCYFVPLINRDAGQKLRHFMDGLRPTLRRDVMLMRPTSYDETIGCAFQT